MGAMKNNWGDVCNSIHRVSGCPMVLEFLELLELFWIFFGTGNVLEKTHFFRLVLELFLNSEFLQSFFCVTTIPVVPCLDLPFVIKYISIVSKAALIIGLAIS